LGVTTKLAPLARPSQLARKSHLVMRIHTLIAGWLFLKTGGTG
jgi:hypothetical protein